jgi:transposase
VLSGEAAEGVGSRVELFEQIRRDRDREALSIRALAERHGVHRRTVRQALRSAVPPPARKREGRPAPALGAYRPLIDAWLRADREAPRKQQHTAKRVWERLRDEYGAQVAETTVRDYVRRRRRELGEPAEAFVPQAHQPGQTAEVDWGEAAVDVAGRRVDVGLFLMRSCYSGAAFVRAFERQTQQAFLEGHVEAFAFFGGVFCVVRYDNLSAAVKLVLRGRRREEADRFVALRSHYLYDSWFTLVGRQGAHEKGGVEGEVGRFRRAHLVPVPSVGSLGELNRRLATARERDLHRTIRGRAESVAVSFAREGQLLRSVSERYDARETSSVRVDQKGLVCVRQHRYSVPIGLVGQRVEALVGAAAVTLRHDGHVVAEHARSYERFGVTARLDHYLELLQRKPGALRGSLPLRQARDAGAWPACFDQLWHALERRYSTSEAARQMVDVLLLCREVGGARTQQAVEGALIAGAHDGRAVALLARRGERQAAPTLDLEPHLEALARRPAPTLAAYDALLGEARS